MQHPVGVVYNPETKRAELDSIWTVLTNPTTLAAFPHTVAAAFLTAGTFVAGIAGWRMVRERPRGPGRAGARCTARRCGSPWWSWSSPASASR